MVDMTTAAIPKAGRRGRWCTDRRSRWGDRGREGQLLGTAREAFAQAFEVIAAIGTALALATAIAVVVLLRSVGAGSESESEPDLAGAETEPQRAD